MLKCGKGVIDDSDFEAKIVTILAHKNAWK